MESISTIATKQVKASQLKRGDLIDGYDKVMLVSPQYWGSMVRVFSLCNINHYEADELVEIAAEATPVGLTERAA